MLASLPGSSAGQMHGVELSGRSDLAVRLTRAATGAPIGWSGSMRLDRGRIAHSMLPDALTDVAIVGHADPAHLVVEKFTAKCGSATLAVAFDRAGWAKNAPLGLAANVVGFTVDERFRAGLPEAYGADL